MGALPLSDCVDRFLSWCSSRFAPATVQFYRHFLDRLRKNLPGRLVSEVSTLDLETWSASRHPLVAAKRFFRWCHRKAKFLTDDPSAEIKLPPEGRRTRTLTRGERVRYRREAPAALRLLILALEESGARPNEWREATWEQIAQVDAEGWSFAGLESGLCFLRLERFKGQARRENPNVTRSIPISARLGRAIARIGRRRRLLRGPILLSSRRRNAQRKAFADQARPVRTKLGDTAEVRAERIVPYSYRHTLATELARRGTNGRLLADFLGHSSLDMLAWYVHPQQRDLQHLLDRPKRSIKKKTGEA